MVSTTLVFTTLLAASAQAITLTLPKSTSLGQRIAINPDIVNTAKPASLGERMIKRAIHSEYLDPHNAARAARGAQALTWSDSLASKAQAWANGCKFQHSGAGENLAAGTGSFTPAAAIKLWTDEARESVPYHGIFECWIVESSAVISSVQPFQPRTLPLDSGRLESHDPGRLRRRRL